MEIYPKPERREPIRRSLFEFLQGTYNDLRLWQVARIVESLPTEGKSQKGDVKLSKTKQDTKTTTLIEIEGGRDSKIIEIDSDDRGNVMGLHKTIRYCDSDTGVESHSNRYSYAIGAEYNSESPELSLGEMVRELRTVERKIGAAKAQDNLDDSIGLYN